MNLPELRIKIDAIDSKLIELLNERADLVHDVGRVKRESGQEIYAPEREEQLLQSLVKKSKGRLPEISIRAIYREIMSASLALEKDLVIAYLGPEATDSHQAARVKFGASLRYSAQPSIGDVFKEVVRGKADYGVVPIENSTEGAVSHTLDVFMDCDLKICAQILLKVEHHLMASASIPRPEIQKIYSHPQVFGQCRQWLGSHFPDIELIQVSSTTLAAELARDSKNSAAIAGRMAAELYHLNLLEESIQDIANNTTRFLVIGQRSCPRTGNDKTSILFSIQDKVGALAAALEPFSQLKISLSKIESRPSERNAWEYSFFVDILGHSDDPEIMKALEQLQQHCALMKILGSYPNTGS